jgi:hypothetical protein
MEPCRAGVCGCPENTTACSRACVDIATNDRHCGGCDIWCGTGGRVCTAGECVCPSLSVESTGFLLPELPECSTFATFDTGACRAEASRACAEKECFRTAFGPTAVPGVGPAVACLDAASTETTFSELASHVAECDGVTQRHGASCTRAIHLHCASTGATSGFGGATDDDGDVSITCLDNAVVTRVPRDAILAPFPGCDGESGWACTGNAWNACVSMGHLGGFGPITITDSEVDIVCLTEPRL